MTNKLGVKEVKRELQRIVNERGYEYVYERPTYEDEYGEIVEPLDCHYSDSEGNPSCLVGVLLHDVAPEIYRELHHYEWDGSGYGEPRAASVEELYVGGRHYREIQGIDLNEIFEPEALQVLTVVQTTQDIGESWGKAVDSVAERF